ncbi:3-hydroxyacyl-CoA dehydrogenase NAD-binding domain-containing protein [Rhodoplanes sp. TEM]|uniref:3-hydroxyacyl-CoA dehydrogenase NAD-binding domain-containing protein n=1 Tax=Rhodoplanes tepidamans TaxID=200616 RepID=A0ABT5JE39_RHOTP|nr:MULTISPECIES: 3-hydroxyacyl-CoA dehydrogenase NAD-binding domain-containing protein [Rhodoplanes]MDC7787611.1 3-hydroxyacyl-CoA dehydrogenase NAD-binding domain-containing protein [Rhodoplanes tepidamans]MDC7988031.1 3-hydroxyacyl-CoA dehydrogenase NAD-binding domain-containing protein [Rhodoplanes sp. TEM]MDQ0358039.1 3-hydroxybutyryl-CoA dehydrogenase [Rhodoplanes tepidamans]
MIRTIGVVGAGTMGHGIAEAFALGGFDVRLQDPSAAVLAAAKPLIREELDLLVEEAYVDAAAAAAALDRIVPVADLSEAVASCDFVIEAAPETLELKQTLFAELDAICRPDAVLASNTSSLPLDGMTARLGPERRRRIMVTHWYNPAHLMPIVELSFFGNMPDEIYAEVEALHRAIGKQTVKVLKDVPGLVANRIQQGVAREVFSIIEQGIAAPEDVDRALKFGPAFRYATTGQLEVADFGGLDIWCVVGDNLLAVMDDSRRANEMLRAKVREGKLGLKSGEGFFTYPPDRVAAIRKQFMRKLVHQLKASAFYA